MDENMTKLADDYALPTDMDEIMATDYALSAEMTEFPELSAYSREKIEISALSVRWALEERGTVETSEYKEALAAAYAVALMYRSGLVQSIELGYLSPSRPSKAKISQDYKPLIEAVLWRTMLRHHKDLMTVAEDQVERNVFDFIQMRAASKYERMAVSYVQAVERALDGKEGTSDLDDPAKKALFFARAVVNEHLKG